MPTLLAIDDEPLILDCFRELFPEEEVTVETAATGAEGVKLFEANRPDAVIVDVRLPDESGLEVYRRIQEIDSRVPVILVTGYGSADTAIEAMQRGAYDYVVKPFDTDQLRDLISRAFAIRRLMSVPATLPDASAEDGRSDVLVGNCPAMREVYKAIGRVASQDVTVLILGESGTGKELVARAIYHHSKRASKPFLAINCAAIPEALLESELFGHEKGAFTGAERRRIGKFEQCHGGTLFLDEIGDMTPLTQTKMLRVLQDGQFERVGGNEVITTDVRVIAATNRDLGQLIASGKFRQDLYYRLNVYTIQLPPLRERGEDLPLLLDHFLKRFGRGFGKEAHGVSPEALEMLRHHSWPGNVRELQSTLKQAILQAAGPVLVPEFFPAALRGEAGPETAAGPAEVFGTPDLTRLIEQQLQAGSTNLFAEFTSLTERLLLLQVLRHTGGNQSQAARILGINRATLRAKLVALGISIERSMALDDETAT